MMMGEGLGLDIVLRTIKDKLKATVIITLIFMGMGVMYAGIYPSFKGSLEEIVGQMPEMGFIRGFESVSSYLGFLNMEMYQIFWVLILAILIGYIAASLISEEIESETIDMLLANPIPRRQIVIEKFLGLVPLVIIVNIATFATIGGMTVLIGESISFTNLLTTHILSIPYLLAIASIGLLISTYIDKKMKASIIMIAVVVGMYILKSISLLAPDYEAIGLVSLVHYYDPADILLHGNLDIVGVIVMLAVMAGCLFASMLYFERRDIAIS